MLSCMPYEAFYHRWSPSQIFKAYGHKKIRRSWMEGLPIRSQMPAAARFWRDVTRHKCSLRKAPASGFASGVADNGGDLLRGAAERLLRIHKVLLAAPEAAVAKIDWHGC